MEIVASQSVRPGDLYIVNPETDALMSWFEKGATLPDTGRWERGAVYVINQGELFIAGTVQDASTGELIHKEDRYSTFFPPTVTPDAMYLSTKTEGIVAFDREKYEIKWIYQPSSSLNTLSPVAILDGIGYVIFSDATVRAFNLEMGDEEGYWQPSVSELWFWPICSFPPVLCTDTARAGLTTSEDMIFVSLGNGKLYAFKP